MSLLTVQQIVRTGVVKAALVAADVDGDRFFNDGKTYLEINNADASGMTLTIVAQKLSRVGQSQSEIVTVAAATVMVIGPFEVSVFNTDGAQEVELEYSSITSLTVAVYSVNNKAN